MDEIRVTHGHERDPHRRWLRHTYQEGPGFRFLATRGGRPPEQGPSGSVFAVVRQRARVVRIAREEGIAAALELGLCSRTSLWRWRIREVGPELLDELDLLIFGIQPEGTDPQPPSGPSSRLQKEP